MSIEGIEQNSLKRVVGELKGPDAVDRIEALTQMDPFSAGILMREIVSAVIPDNLPPSLQEYSWLRGQRFFVLIR